MIPIRSLPSSVLILAFLLSISADARAQYGMTEGGITGVGVVSISRQPERMRVQVLLQGKGSTLKEALAAIKTRGDAARKQLTALGAEKDSIKLDSPRIGANPNENQNQVQMRRMQM